MSPYHVELVSGTDAVLDKLAENAPSKTDAIRKTIWRCMGRREANSLVSISSSRMRREQLRVRSALAPTPECPEEGESRPWEFAKAVNLPRFHDSDVLGQQFEPLD